jgi:hypothetical protein
LFGALTVRVRFAFVLSFYRRRSPS